MVPTDEDRRFFEEGVGGLLDQLYGAALRLAKNGPDAEDLVAEAVEKAWAALPSLKEKERFRAWIFRILTNTFLSHCRKISEKREEISIEEKNSGGEETFSLFEHLHQPFLLWWSHPEKEFLNKLLREEIEKAIDALPEAFRTVIILAELEGFSYRECAGILKAPVGTVRSRLARGRALLQKALWEYGKEAGLVQAARHPGGKARIKGVE